MAIVISEIVGFLLILFVLYRYARPPLKKALDRQKETIAQQVAESEQAKQRLDDAERKHAQALEEARVEAAKIRDGARAEAMRISEEMQAQAEAEVAKIRQRGEEQINLQRQQMIRELRAELGGSSLSSAERMVREHLADPGAQSATVDRFLDDLEGMAPGTQQQDTSVTSGASGRGES